MLISELKPKEIFFLCMLGPPPKNIFYLKNPRILLFEKIGGMATWMPIGDRWQEKK